MATDVAIIGAGIGGMHAALLLAGLGRRVTLIERAPWIGGSFHLLDHTFPTDSCGLCFLEPAQAPTYCPTFECDRHPLIDLLPLTTVQSVEGTAGDFSLTLRKAPRFVHPARCDSCGLCEAVCPAEGPSQYEGAIAPRKAIYAPPARGLPATYIIDPQLCTRCGRCVEACPQGAIDLNMSPETEQLDAGALIASPGLIPFAAENKGEYGYGVFDNVVTSLQFERLMSYSGSTTGQLLRPSDGRPARKIAFISCVGSRDASIGREYCSSICCMITAKQATVARQMDSHVESTVFFTDLRAGGKDYERYLAQRTTHPQVRYQRCQVSTIKQRQQSRDLMIEYWSEAGERREERFDLVVLAVGFGPDEDIGGIEIECNAYGFASAGRRLAPESDKAGIIPIGGFTGPKDIPDTIMEASAAAALAAICAGASGEPDIAQQEAIRPGLDEEEPQTGVFLCGSLDELDEAVLLDEISHWPGIAVADQIADSLTAGGRDALIARANEAGLNRLVIADVASRLDAGLDSQILHIQLALGLPDSAFAIVNLHECLRGNNGHTAETLALSATQMAVARLRYRSLSEQGALASSEPASADRKGVSATVIGAGPAGLSAALTLADLGWTVALIEREQQPGGRLHHITQTADGEETAGWLAQQIEHATTHKRIALYTDAEILSIEPVEREYSVRFQKPDSETEIISQSIILATGGTPAATEKYAHGANSRVVTQTELETMLRNDADSLAAMKQLAMIQCVDSRDEAHPYCSHVCCSQAVRNAMQLKQLNPSMDVFILYREMHTPGMHELAYQAARKAGVLFIRYDLSNEPITSAGRDDTLHIRISDPIIDRPIEIDADMLVLSTGLRPAGAPAWSDSLGLTSNLDGFLVSEHAKMRPLNLDSPGIFAGGSALGPCFVEEAITQGRGAAAQAAIYLERQARERPMVKTIAIVNERLCSGCELCINACPYHARIMDEEFRVARVIESLCAGCGACAMACPNGASRQRLFEMQSILEVIDTALWQ